MIPLMAVRQSRQRVPAFGGPPVAEQSELLQRLIRDLLAMRNHPVASLDRFGRDRARFELSR